MISEFRRDVRFRNTHNSAALRFFSKKIVRNGLKKRDEKDETCSKELAGQPGGAAGGARC